ncbi:DUF3916 domain-containing protein [Metabacillus malikii]|uniref:DUF3916 domain-containing protein n=1 Tax=Metabacillus malikii TaxID=1504265 RepID=A0ABT9ZCA5_9BACI|nr:DUF3916 domain-containing protein [Metabacillus malikii]MDQ0229889.1 hypothetical protein [Metabacillus malikii]
MRVKKVRGAKRKLHRMIKRINDYTSEFPTEFHNDYWHLALPVAQGFIDSEKTPKKYKRYCLQTLLDSAVNLYHLKPNDEEKYRIVVTITFPNLWSSQIIVFKGDSHFNGFFYRNTDDQRWLQLSENRDIRFECKLSVPNDWQIYGFTELITEEDGSYYEGERWFIGELL